MLEFSEDCLDVLRLLKDRHNVLISGPPGTGKSLLLNEVARAFEFDAQTGPVHDPDNPIAIPSEPPFLDVLQSRMPSFSRTNRKVFRTVFHQNSKYRDFITGLVPVIGSNNGSGTAFKVTMGTLYRASDHALGDDGASLLIIDEINRGPAVQVFGGSIVAIESDKRLGENSDRLNNTQYFEILDPTSGNIVEYALPHHLYILAAMNQADTSVEPLDIAFLRRWAPFELSPSESILREFFGLPARNESVLPDEPTSADDVYEAAVQAWENINVRIRLGRGAEFQIGHGVLMGHSRSANLNEVLQAIAESWSMIRAHVDEVFFGDIRGIAEVLNVSSSVADHPYSLEDKTFADEPRLELKGPRTVSPTGIYRLLRAIAE